VTTRRLMLFVALSALWLSVSRHITAEAYSRPRMVCFSLGDAWLSAGAERGAVWVSVGRGGGQ
jgi:hypothetical protein